MDEHPPGRDRDIDDEIQWHLHERTRELIDQGMSAEQAEIEARRHFGNLERVRHDLKRLARGSDRAGFWRWVVSGVRQDVQVGVRRLSRTPGFTVIAVATMALGIGATSAIFSILNGVVLRPLDLPEPERLVRVWESSPARGWDFFAVSQPNYLDFRDGNRTFEHLAAIGVDSYNLTGDGEPERLDAFAVTANFAAAVGLRPLLGRMFTAEEDAPGAEQRVAILGEGLWRRRFGADPDVAGSEIQLNGEAHTVLGVLPGGSISITRGDLYVPLRPRPTAARGDHRLSVLGRMLADVTVEKAEADLDTVAARLAREYPDSNEGFDTALLSLHDAVVGDDVRSALYMLLGAVAFVLLIACANLSNLLLARAAGRHREIAIYAALGASRGRIIGQLLTESMLLGILGGGLGVLLGWQIVRAVRSFGGDALPRLNELSLDGQVLGFTLAVSLLAGLLSGLTPAWQAVGSDLQASIREGARGTAGSRRALRAREALMVAEVALAVVLVTGATLLMRSFWSVQSVQPGMDVDRVLTLSVNLPARESSQPGDLAAITREVLAAIEALPGVEAAASSSGLPFGDGDTVMDYVLEGEDLNPQGAVPAAFWRLVSPDVFATLGVAVVRGRAFNGADDTTGTDIAIISQNMADAAWPGEDPIGKRFHGWRDPDRLFEVVGVVADVRERSLEQDARSMVYLPYYKYDGWSDLFLLVRASGNPADVTEGVRAAIARTAPDLPVAQVRPLRAVMEDTLGGRQLNVSLVGAFALLALSLAAAGVYGVMSYAVTQRAPEIGIRMALGARAPAVLRMVLTHGMRSVLVGSALGLAAALGVTRFLESMLFGVQPQDPASLGAAVLFLCAVAAAAIIGPAVRAARMDPARTLRGE